MYSLSEKAISEKYEDLLFTKVMALYAAEESEKILSEIENEEPADPKNIEKIYSKTERRENFSTLWKVSKKLITFAAMVVFVAVVSLSSVVVASAEAREAVAEAIYHLMVQDYGRYTRVTIGESTGFIDPEIYTWENAYAPTYMPEGFELSNFSCTLSQQSVDYVCGEDFIYFIQAHNSTGQIDTENAEIVENLIIGDSSALFVVKDNITQVSWSVGDTMFLICGTAIPEEVLKVAKSIKPIGYFKTEEPEGEYEFVDPELYDWEGAYAPTYVPEGFVLEELSKNKSQKIAKYFSDNAYISFSQAYNVVKQIDTENAERNEDIQIGDSTGLLVVNDEITYVLWNIGDTVFHIYGTCETDEIIKMAKGIKPIGKTVTEEPTEEYEFVDPEIYTWDNAYGMTYVPDGFNLSGVYKHPGQSIIDYSKENEYFSFLQAQEASADVDTENAQIVERIIINNSEGLLVVKNGLTQVVWSEKNIYMTIIGTAPTEEIIKVAEGIKPIGKTETEEPTEEYEFIDPEIYTWDNAYGMTYVPEGFKLYDVQNRASQKITNYIYEEKVITFSQAFNVISHLDTEDADITKEIQIGESKGFLVVKDDWACVTWSIGDVLLKVSGTAPTEEIIKIAEGVRPMN